MQHHISHNVSDLIRKIFYLRRKAKDTSEPRTISEIFKKLENGTFDYLGERFTWMKTESKSNLNEKAQEIINTLQEAQLQIASLTVNISTNKNNLKEGSALINTGIIAKLLSDTNKGIDRDIDNLKQLQNPLIEIEVDI
jgi:hypothetical protein